MFSCPEIQLSVLNSRVFISHCVAIFTEMLFIFNYVCECHWQYEAARRMQLYCIDYICAIYCCRPLIIII